MRSRALRVYWDGLVAGGCIICGGPAEIAHAHSGSIVERMGEPKAKGKRLARMDWLVLPLCPAHHRSYKGALDLDVKGWERQHGPQAEWIDLLCHRSGIDLWARAKEGRK